MQAPCPPLALRTQVHALVADATAADREVDRLRAARAVRVVRCGAAHGDTALVFESDLEAALAAAAAGVGGEAEAAVAAFVGRVLPAHVGQGAARAAVVVALGTEGEVGDGRVGAGGQPPTTTPPVAPDAALACLLRLGALVPDPRDPAALLFSAPGAGRLGVALRAARAEVTRGLVRRAHAQVPEAALTGTARLRTGRGLDARFVVRDLIGAGRVARVPTPAGWVLRLVAQGG